MEEDSINDGSIFTDSNNMEEDSINDGSIFTDPNQGTNLGRDTDSDTDDDNEPLDGDNESEVGLDNSYSCDSSP